MMRSATARAVIAFPPAARHSRNPIMHRALLI
jgi:hypothetical protein